jgi:hypothetical protein
MDEAVLLEHCPHPSEQQSQSAERRSVQKKCEKSGLESYEVVGQLSERFHIANFSFTFTYFTLSKYTVVR